MLLNIFLEKQTKCIGPFKEDLKKTFLVILFFFCQSKIKFLLSMYQMVSMTDSIFQSGKYIRNENFKFMFCAIKGALQNNHKIYILGQITFKIRH